MEGLNPTQLAINIVILSSFYVLFAMGLALAFGVMRIINFAHGELYMLGGYAIWVMLTLVGNLPLPLVFIISLVVGPLAVGGIGYLIELGLFRPLRVNPFAGFMASNRFGVCSSSHGFESIW